MSVIDAPSAIPAPRFHHLAAAKRFEGWLHDGARRLHAAYGPGLIALVLESEPDEWQLGFTPRHLANVPHVMAMGVPEEAAVTIIDQLGSYNPALVGKVLVVEDGYAPNGPFSFIEISLA